MYLVYISHDDMLYMAHKPLVWRLAGMVRVCLLTGMAGVAALNHKARADTKKGF